MSKFCNYGRLVVVRTTWTHNNVGMRFVSYVEDRVGYNYFRWIEQPVSERGKAMICGLLGRISGPEGEIEKISKGCCNEEVTVKKHDSSRRLTWLYVVIAFCLGFSCKQSK
ncbi:hypothetical protein AgCh_024228 [Apium graveolens]